MDLVFYDPEISYEETLQIEQELKRTYPQYAWEVKTKSTCTNIAQGQLPYTSSCDAVSKYPEQCTALALRLRKDDLLELFSYGTRDIERFYRSADSTFFSQSRALGGLYRADEKKNWQSQMASIRGSFSKIEKKIRFEKGI